MRVGERGVLRRGKWRVGVVWCVVLCGIAWSGEVCVFLGLLGLLGAALRRRGAAQPAVEARQLGWPRHSLRLPLPVAGVPVSVLHLLLVWGVV